MCMSTPRVSTPPQPQAAPQAQDAAVIDAADKDKARRRAAAGQQSTILTGAQGATGQASTTGKTLLGG
ncbi:MULTISPECIES: hypothetical protein [Enterobacterales]|uniref:Uncharacterized protein n=1 Tax=Serratia marcescens TaxID=615 RepID=A0ABD5BC57_SERMA|nr:MULTISPECIES: hypothetical protein [Enterobacterales]MDQ9401614.1 hypothetical protein [Serratia marcescens]MDQ9428388.1 hypothetical protein [Serratia marcescens]MDQ9429757.1 hypothetical protein [Serratia marcescens]MDQ9441125.1 hypothetical protein [Serratia marcescens]MDQ9477817.1 hypothetical protein [Serratia marcescens]